MRISNCRIYAKRKHALEGGYIKTRESIRAMVTHYLHEDMDGNVTHYVPIKRTWLSKKFGIAAPLFRGRVATDDIEYKWYEALRKSGWARSKLIKLDESELKAEFEKLGQY